MTAKVGLGINPIVSLQSSTIDDGVGGRPIVNVDKWWFEMINSGERLCKFKLGWSSHRWSLVNVTMVNHGYRVISCLTYEWLPWLGTSFLVSFQGVILLGVISWLVTTMFVGLPWLPWATRGRSKRHLYRSDRAEPASFWWKGAAPQVIGIAGLAEVVALGSMSVNDLAGESSL